MYCTQVPSILLPLARTDTGCAGCRRVERTAQCQVYTYESLQTSPREYTDTDVFKQCFVIRQRRKTFNTEFSTIIVQYYLPGYKLKNKPNLRGNDRSQRRTSVPRTRPTGDRASTNKCTRYMKLQKKRGVDVARLTRARAWMPRKCLPKTV